MTQIFNGLLQVLSGLYLAVVVALVLSLGETDDWQTIAASTIRRSLKFVLSLLLVAGGVWILGH